MMPANLPVGTEELDGLRSLLGAWPIGPVLSLERVQGGATNRVYRVEAERALAFLRIYKRPDRAMVAREHALLAYLRRQQMLVVEVIAATSGATAVEHEHTFAALYAPARGTQVGNAALTLEHAWSAGAALARVHHALAPLADAGHTRWTLSWDGAEWIERLNASERALLAHGICGATDEWALRRLREQRAWLAQPQCLHRYEPRCSAQVTHGDYQASNLFFEGAEVSAIVDWEQAAWMPPAYEVARACAFMFQLAMEPTREFVRGYRSVRPLTLEELDDGARAWGTFSDHHVWPLEETYLNSNPAASRYIVHAPFRPFWETWEKVRGALV